MATLATLWEIMNMTDAERKQLEWDLMSPKTITLKIGEAVIRCKRKLRNNRKADNKTICDVIYKGKVYQVWFVYGFNWTNITF